MSRNITDPMIVGSGIWCALHIMALNADTLQRKVQFVENLKLIQQKFPCKHCKEHFGKYLSKNPISFKDIKKYKGRDLTMFHYMWEFHNAANRQLGKPEMPFDQALDMYDSGFSNEACSVNCQNAGGVSSQVYLPQGQPSQVISHAFGAESGPVLYNNFTGKKDKKKHHHH